MSKGTTTPRRARKSAIRLSRSQSDDYLASIPRYEQPITYAKKKWGLSDINNAAGSAARTFSTHMLTDYQERYDIAWSAIGEYLCSESPPRFNDLVGHGRRALADEDRARRRHHGLADNARAHAAYWQSSCMTIRSGTKTSRYSADSVGFADRVIETIAVNQMAERIGPDRVAVLVAQYQAGNQLVAADQARSSVKNWAARLAEARSVAADVWFWPETPPKTNRSSPFRHRAAANECKRGHPFTESNTRWRKGSTTGSKKRACRECDRIAQLKRKDKDTNQ